MKFKLLLAHTLGIFIGAGIVFYAFTENVIPNIAETLPTDSFFIKLPRDKGKTPHWDVLEQQMLGSLYLFEPYYPHKRKEGHQILEKLAERGYTPAMSTLSSYYFRQTWETPSSEEKYKQDVNNAYKWAKIAAEDGHYLLLFKLIVLDNLDELRDVSDDLKLIDNWLNTTASNVYTIERMSKYYAEHGDEKKAEHFSELARKIDKNPRPYPACSTITPWKGW